MSEFKWHSEGDIILWAVRWYCRYSISYRDLEQMMGERGVPVDHFTIFRWVQRYAPEIDTVADPAHIEALWKLSLNNTVTPPATLAAHLPQPGGHHTPGCIAGGCPMSR